MNNSAEVGGYAKLAQDRPKHSATRLDPTLSGLVLAERPENVPPATNENGPHCCEPLVFLVGRARFELATNGLKVRCSTD